MSNNNSVWDEEDVYVPPKVEKKASTEQSVSGKDNTSVWDEEDVYTPPTKKRKSPSKKAAKFSKLRAFLEGAGQGLSFGFSDEMKAVWDAVGADGDFGSAYAKAVKIHRDEIAQIRKTQPEAYWGGEIASLIIPGMLGPKLISKLGTKTVAKLAEKANKLNRTKTTLAKGAIEGVGRSDAENLKDAATGAVIGATGVGALKAVGAVAKGTKKLTGTLAHKAVAKLPDEVPTVWKSAFGAMTAAKIPAAIVTAMTMKANPWLMFKNMAKYNFARSQLNPRIKKAVQKIFKEEGEELARFQKAIEAKNPKFTDTEGNIINLKEIQQWNKESLNRMLKKQDDDLVAEAQKHVDKAVAKKEAQELARKEAREWNQESLDKSMSSGDKDTFKYVEERAKLVKAGEENLKRSMKKSDAERLKKLDITKRNVRKAEIKTLRDAISNKDTSDSTKNMARTALGSNDVKVVSKVAKQINSDAPMTKETVFKEIKKAVSPSPKKATGEFKAVEEAVKGTPKSSSKENGLSRFSEEIKDLYLSGDTINAVKKAVKRSDANKSVRHPYKPIERSFTEQLKDDITLRRLKEKYLKEKAKKKGK